MKIHSTRRKHITTNKYKNTASKMTHKINGNRSDSSLANSLVTAAQEEKVN